MDSMGLVVSRSLSASNLHMYSCQMFFELKINGLDSSDRDSFCKQSAYVYMYMPCTIDHKVSDAVSDPICIETSFIRVAKEHCYDDLEFRVASIHGWSTNQWS
jgi:hypothetical protein